MIIFERHRDVDDIVRICARDGKYFAQYAYTTGGLHKNEINVAYTLSDYEIEIQLMLIEKIKKLKQSDRENINY